MKCSSIKLSSRENGRSNECRILNDSNSPKFTPEETHSYSFPFLRRKSSKPTTLAITNIIPSEDIQSFNTGSSLERWSQKHARLKSAKVIKTPTEDDKEFCYETLETDLSLLLNDREELSDDGSLNNLQYEVHTDIEQLLLKSERGTTEEESQEKLKRRRKKRGKDKEHKKKNKTIKFSISKPPSPQTEQVIRVDVTSNVSVGDDDRRFSESAGDDHCGKSPKEVTDDERRELKRNLHESRAEMCDEEFIVRCRQLGLKQRRRRL